MADRTLLVAHEDDETRTFLCDNLTAEGFEVYDAADVAQAKARMTRPGLDVVIVGLNGSSAKLADTIREGTLGVPSTVPLVMLGAADSIERERCYRHGFDVVVPSAFEFGEVLAAVGMLCARNGAGPARRVIVEAINLRVDLVERTVKIGDAELGYLTRLEFDLLATMAKEPTRVFTKQDLMRAVWGHGNTKTSRTLDSHVCRLRNKLSSVAPGLSLCSNIWGVGYRLMVA